MVFLRLKYGRAKIKNRVGTEGQIKWIWGNKIDVLHHAYKAERSKSDDSICISSKKLNSWKIYQN